MNSIKVKICGLTSHKDIAIVNKAQPNYAGFVFAPGRRILEVEYARQLITELDRSVYPVGVFVNETIERIIEITKKCSLKVIQLHGQESTDTVQALKKAIKSTVDDDVEVWKAVRVKDELSLEEIERFTAKSFTETLEPFLSSNPKDTQPRILLDTWNPNLQGGTGETFIWHLLKGLSIPFILAGGLTPENVENSIDSTKPWGVDVSSGVETDGMKSEEKVMKFVASVRNAVV